jgi:SAM-dependent methyltransferase
MNQNIPSCRFCGTKLEHIFADLGETPLANRNLLRDQIAEERKYPLMARVCGACFLVQVDHSVSPDELFSDYDYFSSYSESWIAHAKRYCDGMRERFTIGAHSFVVEIASNDGYLLQHFKAVEVLGVEPAANVAKVAIARGIPTEVAFFGVDTARAIVARGRHADLIVANNVLAHAPDIRDFVGGFAVLLAPDGVATFEFPHLLRLIEGGHFDTIYHEHFFYLSLLTVERVLHAAGLRVFDVEELRTHGGSLRIFVCRSTAAHATTMHVEALRASEREHTLDRLAGYEGFAACINNSKAQFQAYLVSAKAAGRKVAAYGAAAKGNTFLNVCNVAYPQIEAVYDRSRAKQGKFTPGSHIPILAPEEIVALKPDDVVILPWNISDEVIQSMSFLREWGGRFVIAIPKLQIL